MEAAVGSLQTSWTIRENRPGAREPDVNHTEFGTPTTMTETPRGVVVADAHGHVRKSEKKMLYFALSLKSLLGCSSAVCFFPFGVCGPCLCGSTVADFSPSL